METVKICDICGEIIENRHSCRDYKIKRRNFHYRDFLPNGYKWDCVSAHESCIKLLLEARNKMIDELISKEEIRKQVMDD